MSEELTVERSTEDAAAKLKAYVEQRIHGAMDEAKTRAELTQSPPSPVFDWELVAWGPWQLPFNPPADPGRIIFKGEEALIATAVVMNDDTSVTLGGFGAKVQLNYHTANTQTMLAVPALSTSTCIPIVAHQLVYVHVWRFTPQEAACLFETNICARVCNCSNHAVPGWAGFVRHVYDFDPESLGLVPWSPPAASPGWQFDRPIRYMVSDPAIPCDCP